MTFKELAVGQRFRSHDEEHVKIKTPNNQYVYEGTVSYWNIPAHQKVIPIRQTPRTDAEIMDADLAVCIDVVSADFAKQLEQELAESLAREQKLRDDLEDIRTILGR